jgi:hypothetical protein
MSFLKSPVAHQHIYIVCLKTLHYHFRPGEHEGIFSLPGAESGLVLLL